MRTIFNDDNVCTCVIDDIVYNIYYIIDENGNITEIRKTPILDRDVITADYINLILLNEKENIKYINDYINSLKKIISFIE